MIRENMKTQGLSAVQIAASVFLSITIALVLLLGLTHFSKKRSRPARQWSAAYTALEHQSSELPSRCSYDELESIAGTSSVVQDGFPFELVIEVNKVDYLKDAKEVIFTVNWEDKLGRHTKTRPTLMTKPR